VGRNKPTTEDLMLDEKKRKRRKENTMRYVKRLRGGFIMMASTLREGS
jgi:hypothetical protein